ncbi:transposase [Enterococcus mundtii]|uniref:transposase n=1 Tax=Enterococcus TaxID=1350 RepID=UPI000D3934AC|nr:transposase [Enterococcus mundtii]MZZ59906.1 hypothetical protein [Enterococcus mundtii]MZZ62068.1 hypothetical protein [Enterococcus mundtii]MZZ69150.1 hypothetical protein [Enterococcus mundtii]MZZ98693.1 hypothetical protein [Enterococcus mundtii]NAA00921.1 hypothetical protein [Enterococcus mundtii]
MKKAFQTHYSNRTSEGRDNTIKVITLVAYGYRNFRHRIYLIQGLVFQYQSRTKKNQSKHISTSIDSR